MSTPLTAVALLKTRRIFTCDPNDPLSKAAARLQSSHDAVFVVENDTLLGVINPYHTLYASSYPGETKAINCLFHPPKLSESTTIEEVARQMLESKVYFLPVFGNKQEWLRVVSVRRILSAISNFADIREALPKLELRKKIMVVDTSSNVTEVHTLLKQRGVSKLPVVDENEVLVGLITRNDLKELLASPDESQSKLSRKGEKQKKLGIPVTKYMNRNVITLGEMEGIKPIVDLMLEHEIGSVVIVDEKNSPVGIVSTTDILRLVAEVDVI